MGGLSTVLSESQGEKKAKTRDSNHGLCGSGPHWDARGPRSGLSALNPAPSKTERKTAPMGLTIHRHTLQRHRSLARPGP